MPEVKRPLLADLMQQLGLLGADLREMAALRWQLARLEFEADLRVVKRLTAAMLVAAVMAVSAMPLLAVWVADLLNRRLGIQFAGWLLIFGLGLLLGGAATGYVAWRCFRARFTALEQTREELREDLVWLREWTGTRAEGGGMKAEG